MTLYTCIAICFAVSATLIAFILYNSCPHTWKLVKEHNEKILGETFQHKKGILENRTTRFFTCKYCGNEKTTKTIY